MEVWQLIEKKNWKAIPRELGAGADPNKREERGKGQKPASSPLGLAIEHRNAKVALLLIEAGGAIDGACNYRGDTPLEAAALYEQPEVVRQLLRRGADPRAGSHKNVLFSCYSAGVLRAVLEELPKETIDALINGPFGKRDSRTPLQLAVWSGGAVDSVRLLLGAGADVGATDNSGATALHYAAQRGADPEVVELLLESGAKVDAKDKRGRTPLSVAVSKGHGKLRVLLEGAGASALTPGGFGPRSSGRLELDKHIDALLAFADKLLRGAKLPRGKIEHYELVINPWWTLSEILVFVKGDDEVHEIAVDALASDYPRGIGHLGDELLALAKKLKLRTKRTRDDFCASLPGLMVSYPLVERMPAFVAKLAQARKALGAGGVAFDPASPLNWDQPDVLRRRLQGHFRGIADRPDALQAIAELFYATPAARKAFLTAAVSAPDEGYALDELAGSIASELVGIVSKGTRAVRTLRLCFCAFEELLPYVVRVTRDGGQEEQHVISPRGRLPAHVDFLDDEDFLLPALCERLGLSHDALSWTDGLACAFLRAAVKEAVWLARTRLAKTKKVTADFAAYLTDDEGDDVAGVDPTDSLPELVRRAGRVLRDARHRAAFAALMYEDPARRRPFEA